MLYVCVTYTRTQTHTHTEGKIQRAKAVRYHKKLEKLNFIFTNWCFKFVQTHNSVFQVSLVTHLQVFENLIFSGDAKQKKLRIT